VLSTSITVGLGVFAGLLVRRLTNSPAFGTFADMLLGITGAFAARVLTDLVLQTHSFPAAAAPLVLGSAVALPAAIHMVTVRQQEASSRRVANPQSQSGRHRVQD
jgi:uncharacterized membrane protein YeaQ/YmgE (transglycosylase-associated protein family)